MQEGIRWTPIEYFNNKVVCDLIENKLVRTLGGGHLTGLQSTSSAWKWLVISWGKGRTHI